jgi:hypothetical protein
MCSFVGIGKAPPYTSTATVKAKYLYKQHHAFSYENQSKYVVF